ncbi:MAG: peptide deformylase [Candidatus Methylomirabilales bacterium]
MSILKIAQMGNPVLRHPADPVPVKSITSPILQKFIDDMIETMQEYNGVGLAAPQVHESLQVVVIEAQDNPRYPDAPMIPLTVLINPTVETLGDETDEDWEGCLSIPDIRGRVPRCREVRVRAHDREGKELDFTAKDFFARVIQHEHDHLQGILFLDRMPKLDTLTYMPEYHRYWANQ